MGMVIGRAAKADDAPWTPGEISCVSVSVCAYVWVHGCPWAEEGVLTSPYPLHLPVSVSFSAGTDVKLPMGLLERQDDPDRVKSKLSYISRKQVRRPRTNERTNEQP